MVTPTNILIDLHSELVKESPQKLISSQEHPDSLIFGGHVGVVIGRVG